MVATAVKGKLPSFSDEELELANTQTILEGMVLAKQDELRSLTQAIAREQALLARQRDEQRHKESEFHGQLKVEREVFDKTLANERDAMRAQIRSLDVSAAELEGKRQEIKRLEVQSEAIRQQHEANTRERLQMQRERLRAAEIKEEAERLKGQAQHDAAELSRKLTELKPLEARLKGWQESLEALKNDLEAREARTQVDLASLSALRQELDPKIELLTTREAAFADKEKRVEALHKEAAQQAAENQQARADLEGLAVRLKDQQAEQRARETQLRQLKQELTVLEARLSAKNPLAGEESAKKGKKA